MTHRTRIYALGLLSLAFLIAIVVLAVLEVAPELAARLEGALGVSLVGFYDALRARKHVVDVRGSEERDEAEHARDAVRERRGLT